MEMGTKADPCWILEHKVGMRVRDDESHRRMPTLCSRIRHRSPFVPHLHGYLNVTIRSSVASHSIIPCRRGVADHKYWLTRLGG